MTKRENYILLDECQSMMNEIKKIKNKKYNTVLESDKQIYIINNHTSIMSFQKIFEKEPKKTVKDLLKPREVKMIEGLIDQGKFPLIATVKEDDQDSFTGYYPLNAGINENLTVHRVKGKLDIIKDFATGG